LNSKHPQLGSRKNAFKKSKTRRNLKISSKPPFRRKEMSKKKSPGRANQKKKKAPGKKSAHKMPGKRRGGGKKAGEIEKKSRPRPQIRSAFQGDAN